MAKVIFFVLLVFNISCSSLSEKEKKYAAIGGAAIVGGLIGSAVAPDNEDRGSHAALWAGVGGALGGLYFVNKQDKEIKQLKASNERLQNLIGEEKEKKLLHKGHDLLGSKLPSKVEGLVSPGGWKLYKISRWVKDEDNSNVFFHQNEMLEIEPPSIGGSE